VQRDFEELPEGAIGSLRDSIMELMLRHAAKGPLVRVQLCLAFAALVAHVPSSQWGGPSSGVVQWLTTQLDGQPPDVSIPVMLEMLVVLPEVTPPQPQPHPHFSRSSLGLQGG
jgi:transportin-3